MWLQVPEQIKQEHLLWEGPLEPSITEASERGRGDVEKHTGVDARSLPVVGIGRPDKACPISKFYSPEKYLMVKPVEADLYVVRLACSLRPQRKEDRVEWARFIVQLLPDETGRQPIALDLYPMTVDQEVKHNVHVTLSSKLSFQEIGTTGTSNSGFQYTELQPIISASGAGEAIATWDYFESKGIAVQGSKFMHLLFKAPIGMQSVYACLDLIADVKIKESVLKFLRIRKKEEASNHLMVQLV